jgi:hypothetical protein
MGPPFCKLATISTQNILERYTDRPGAELQTCRNITHITVCMLILFINLYYVCIYNLLGVSGIKVNKYLKSTISDTGSKIQK